jgi:hypothetical protein
MKVGLMLKERKLSLNELMLLAMLRTAKERNLSAEQQQKIQSHIDRRFEPKQKLYRFI